MWARQTFSAKLVWKNQTEVHTHKGIYHFLIDKMRDFFFIPFLPLITADYLQVTFAQGQTSQCHRHGRNQFGQLHTAVLSYLF